MNNSKIIECCCAGNEKNFALVQIEKKLAVLLLRFYDASKAAKKHYLKLTEYSKVNSFANMVTKIDIDAIKI